MEVSPKPARSLSRKTRAGTRKRVLLIGWDAADWKVARPLMESGQMPHLARLVATGSSGNIGTMNPPLSPMLWTSIATGKRPPKHGVLGFAEPRPDGFGIRPVTILGRTTKAIWNVLNQNSFRPCVVGWWPSHPAEPVNGVIVSNHFHQAGEGPEPGYLPPEAIHPPEWRERLGNLRITPMDLPGELIRLFVPEYHKVDQDKDKRLHTLGKILAETMNLHAAATEVLEHAQWDFAAVYYDAIDHFCHGFMRYHPPQLRVSDADFALYRHVVTAAYLHHDAMLGRLLQLAGPETTVILLSDHGFHPDALRPDYIPAESAGPAVEHSPFGMIALNGPGIRKGETLYGSSLLDVAPTVLHLFGLPVGSDMDGKVLITALEEPGTITSVRSWDEVQGEAGTHPPGAQFDPVASAEVLKQMADLGYIAPPGEDVSRSVAECVAELQYNLARAFDDAGQPAESLPIYQVLHAGDPDDHRYVEKLAGVLMGRADYAGVAALLDDFDGRCAVLAPAAHAELRRRQAARPETEFVVADDKDRRENFERRRLAEQTTGFALLRQVLRLQLDLVQGSSGDAKKRLEELEESLSLAQRPPAMFLARSFAQAGEGERALAWVTKALEQDPDDWQALALAARLQFARRRFAASAEAAAASLALIYFQPLTHLALARALAGLGDLDSAEREFVVALHQRPGLIAAHEGLGRLYARKGGRPADAAWHRTRASQLRAQGRQRSVARPVASVPGGAETGPLPSRKAAHAGNPASDVVVVAGLPRSGTSMTMQMLAAGGIAPLTDGKRDADSDNPRGYFEFERATALLQDATWLPEARGKAVKLALPLLRGLPFGEAFRVIVIERDVREVIASQRAMLSRLGREGAALSDALLAEEYARERERVRAWLEARSDIAVLPIRYDAILTDPHGMAVRIAEFLDREFDIVAATKAVDPSLRRQSA